MAMKNQVSESELSYSNQYISFDRKSIYSVAFQRGIRFDKGMLEASFRFKCQERAFIVSSAKKPRRQSASLGLNLLREAVKTMITRARIICLGVCSAMLALLCLAAGCTDYSGDMATKTANASIPAGSSLNMLQNGARNKQLHVYIPVPEEKMLEAQDSERGFTGFWSISYSIDGVVQRTENYTNPNGQVLDAVQSLDLFEPGSMLLAFEGLKEGEVEVFASLINANDPEKTSLVSAKYLIKVYNDLTMELLESAIYSDSQIPGKVVQLHLIAPAPEAEIAEIRNFNENFREEWVISYSKEGVIERTFELTHANGEALEDESDLDLSIPSSVMFAFVGKSPGDTEVYISCIDPSKPDNPLITAIYRVKVYDDLMLELLKYSIQEDKSVKQLHIFPFASIERDAQAANTNFKGKWIPRYSQEGIVEQADHMTDEDGRELGLDQPSMEALNELALSFEGVAPGIIELALDYINEFDVGGQPIATARYIVQVNEDLTLRILE
ncbi:MAG: hypothetical protein LBU32_17340 [Clostridiales bacterium]|jgi:hypothetical protein|nr:hypothetical protein [Clostridiales bacterium]